MRASNAIVMPGNSEMLFETVTIKTQKEKCKNGDANKMIIMRLFEWSMFVARP
jgi:hypothetical protein